MAATRTVVPRFTGHQVGLFIVLAVLASSACGKTSETAENFETKASEVAHDAGKAAESWADSVYGKVQKGMGWQHENAKIATKNMQDTAGEIAMKTKDKFGDYPSANHASMKATEAKDAMADSADDAKAAMANKAFHAKDTIMNEAGDAKDALNDHAGDVKQHIKSTTGEAQEKLQSRADEAYSGAKKTSKRASDAAGKAYDDAKQKASEAYESAKESMTTGAKRGYEAAKEKASKAAGDFGAAMKSEEL